MNTQQTATPQVERTQEMPNAKQAWETPQLRSLDIEQTESGATPGAPEATTKAPGS